MRYSTPFIGIFGAALAACVVFSSGMTAEASIYTLTDYNSTVTIDPVSTGLPSNMINWWVDGTNHLFEQSFWFRIGEQGPEQMLSQLGPVFVYPGPGTRGLDVVYERADVTIDIFYLLTGGTSGSGVSDVAETIRIINTSDSTLNVHFFQYVDFDLNGTPGNDRLLFPNANAVRQYEPGVILTETVVTPVPNRREGGVYPITRNKLTDGDADDLSNTPGLNVEAGPGDMTWAFQWDVTLGANDTFLISKDKQIVPNVPEPATIVIWLLLGMGSWLGMRVWRRRGRVGLGEDIIAPNARQPWSPEARQAIHDIIARNVTR